MKKDFYFLFFIFISLYLPFVKACENNGLLIQTLVEPFPIDSISNNNILKINNSNRLIKNLDTTHHDVILSAVDIIFFTFENFDVNDLSDKTFYPFFLLAVCVILDIMIILFILFEDTRKIVLLLECNIMLYLILFYLLFEFISDFNVSNIKIGPYIYLLLHILMLIYNFKKISNRYFTK